MLQVRSYGRAVKAASSFDALQVRLCSIQRRIDNLEKKSISSAPLHVNDNQTMESMLQTVNDFLKLQLPAHVLILVGFG